MHVPITGILLIPLGLLIAFLPWRYCLIGLVTFAMLSPAAVINAGHFGLQPGYYLALLLIGRTALEVLANRFTLNAFVLARMRLLFYFVIITFIVLFIAICFFQGQVETLRGTAGFNSNLAQTFRVARENFTQTFYIVENMCLIYILAHQGAKRPLEALLRDWDLALVCGLCLAGAVCIWQFTSLYAGLYFPADFFYSNAGYSRADSQTMVGLFRINGPFEEPSALGYYFTGFILFAWLRYRIYPTAFSTLMVALCIFCMIVSTSTTAFFGLFLFCVIAFYDVLSGRVHLLARDLRLSTGQLVAIGIGLAAILGGSIVYAAYSQNINLILGTTVFNKAASSSFKQRSFADVMAMRIFVETYGIGIGLGSHKPNSLFLMLLSNTGLCGVLTLGGFIYTLVRPLQIRIDRRKLNLLRQAFRPFQWGLVGLVLIHFFSNPNLSTMALWVEMGGLLALHAALHRYTVAQTAGVITWPSFIPPHRFPHDMQFESRGRRQSFETGSG